jgi:phage gp36-like protein
MSAWRRDGTRLAHDSGLAVEYDDDLGWVATEDTAETWAAFQQAFGTPLEALPRIMQRLCLEAAQWAAQEKS